MEDDFGTFDAAPFILAVVVAILLLVLYGLLQEGKRMANNAGADAPPPPYSAATSASSSSANAPPPPFDPRAHKPREKIKNAKLSKEEAAGRDYVLAIDISGSMLSEDCPGPVSRFEAASEGAVAFAETLEKLDPDGFDLCLFSDKMQWFKAASADVVRDVFAKHSPDGGTLLAPVLKRSIEAFFAQRQRPLTIVVITDGCPQDKVQVMDTIVNASRRLHDSGGADANLGITFIQIGHDKQASRFLKELDDDLQEKYDSPLDIVDTVPMTEVARRGGIRQVLINAIND